MTAIQRVPIKESDLDIAKLVANDIKKPEEMIAAIIVLEDQIAALKHLDDHIKEMIRTTKYEDILESLESRALIGDKESKVAIEVTTKLGEVVTATIYKDTDSCFQVAKDMSDKTVLDTVVPE